MCLVPNFAPFSSSETSCICKFPLSFSFANISAICIMTAQLPFISKAPLPKSLFPFNSAENGSVSHMDSSAIGTTSRCPLKAMVFSPCPKLAIMLGLPFSFSYTPYSTPILSKKPETYSPISFSIPVKLLYLIRSFAISTILLLFTHI